MRTTASRRFLHAADLHLDSPLRTMALRNAALSERLRIASREALRRLVDLAIAENVRALLLAGDVFDSDAPDLTARAALLSELGRLEKAGIDTVLIWGNHDAALGADSYGALGARIHVLDKARPSFHLEGAAIHGVGFAKRHVPESLLPLYPDPEPGRINIGLMHTSLDGSPQHDRYAPCAVSDLLAHGYDYWALGHIHKRSEHRGEGALAVMAGVSQGRHINEDAGGSATLVTIDAEGVRAEARVIAPLSFMRLTVPLEAGITQIDRQNRITEAAQASGAAERDTALRITLEGLGAAPLMAEPEDARVFVEEALAALDGVHLDKVALRPGAAAPGGSDIGDLSALMRKEAGKQGFRDEIEAELAEWRKALPRELRGALPGEDIDALAEEGMAAVLAALGGGGKTP